MVGVFLGVKLNFEMIIMKRTMTTFIERVRGCFLAGAAMAFLCWGLTGTAGAQTPADMTPALQKVLDLARGGMSDDFIENWIKNSGANYTLSVPDITYLHQEGVSDPVIKALMQTTPPPSSTAPVAPTAAATSGPPPVDASSSPSPDAPPPGSAPEPEPAPTVAPAPAQPALVDNFFADGGLNSALWLTQSGPLSALAAVNGRQVFPELAFSPSGMQMSGARGPEEFTGIQSAAGYAPPFTFSATVSGLAQEAIPFEIYLVSADLQQWVSVAGHLGGRGEPHGHLNVGIGFGHVFGDTRIPLGGGRSPEYGFWINHTGSGYPISMLGYKVFEDGLAGVPYTVQISAGPDGAAAVTLLNPGGAVLAAQTVPLGTGPFYVVLAERGGRTLGNWQSVQLTPTAPPPPPAPVVEAAPAAPAVPTMDYFQAQLAPYGNWVTLPDYGLCWQPAVGPGWRPYYDGGSWQYTDAGWYWQSDYPWGDIAFHYGRWLYTPTGWAWVPGFDYAPSWVLWRHADADGYLGWAPLPPGAVFVDGGWRYGGVAVAADFDFGLGVNFFTFVPNDHFWEHDYRRWVVPHDRVEFFYRHSEIENHYRYDHGVFVNVGFGRDRIAVLTHRDVRDIRVADFHEVRRHEEVQHIMVRRDDLHAFHPGARPDARGFAADHRAGAADHWAGGPDHGPNHAMAPEHAMAPDRGGAFNHDADRGNEAVNHGFQPPVNHGAPPVGTHENQPGSPRNGSPGGGNPSDKKNH
jgi:hypothetical protein